MIGRPPVFNLGPCQSFCPLQALELIAWLHRAWLDGQPAFGVDHGQEASRAVA